MHNVTTCRWGSGMPGQPFHYTGTDFLEERDGRVSRLYTFIDQKLSILTHLEDQPPGETHTLLDVRDESSVAELATAQVGVGKGKSRRCTRIPAVGAIRASKRPQTSGVLAVEELPWGLSPGLPCVPESSSISGEAGA